MNFNQNGIRHKFSYARGAFCEDGTYFKRDKNLQSYRKFTKLRTWKHFTTSFTSTDTIKELPSPLVTKINSVGFIHDAELLCKKWSQKIKPLWRYFMQKNQAIWLEETILGPKLKKNTVKEIETTDSICSFYKCLPIYKKLALKLN